MVGCVEYIRCVVCQILLLKLFLSTFLCQMHFVSNLLCFDNYVSLTAQNLSRRFIGNSIRSDLARFEVRCVVFVASLVCHILLMLFISIFISPIQFSSNELFLTVMCISMSTPCLVGLLKILLAPVRTMCCYVIVRSVSHIFAPLWYSEMLLAQSRLPLFIYSLIASLYFLELLSQCSDLRFQFVTIHNSSSTACFNGIIDVSFLVLDAKSSLFPFHKLQINFPAQVGMPLLSRLATIFMMVGMMRCGLRQ